MALRWLYLLLALSFAMPAYAVQPEEVLDDPALEARARDLSKELRCLVCRNQSIDDSGAPLARDLRLLVRERLVAGDSDQDAMAYIVDRYGEFVLLRPPLNAGNLALWFAGPVLLIIGGVIAVVFVRRRKPAPTSSPNGLTEEEAERLSELTGDN